MCWRAFNLGFIAKYCHQSVVYHVGGATLQMGSPFKTFLNFRNSLMMMVKNLPKNKLFTILFLRMILDGIAAFKFLFDNKPKHFFAIGKAHFYFYYLLFSYLNKRDNTQKANYFYHKSIVYSYFVKKKEVFSDLQNI